MIGGLTGRGEADGRASAGSAGKKVRRSIKVRCLPTAATLPLKNRDLGTSRWQLPKGQWAEHTSVARMSEEAWRSQCPAIRPLSGDKRKWLRHGQADVIDPEFRITLN